MIVKELREKYALNILLKIAGISKQAYYYAIKNYNYKNDKDFKDFTAILDVFNKNLQKYGSPRITIDLKNKGINFNHKKVERLMKKYKLKARVIKRKYKSYLGDVGLKAPNILNRDFKENLPYKKLGTDVTVFITKYGKLYLSPIIDFYTREVLAYNISSKPDFRQIVNMFNMLYEKHGDKVKGAILHSDQGWQYQMKAYQNILKSMGMVQSMSRKGNCLDNSPTENFFARLKEEIYYGKEDTFKSLKDIKLKIVKYIDYYNNERIVTRLKNSPVKFRNSCII